MTARRTALPLAFAAALALAAPSRANPPPDGAPDAEPAPPPAPPDPFLLALEAARQEASRDPRAVGAAPPSNPADLLPRIQVERYRLANGLNVVLAPGGSERQAAVFVRYRTGTGDLPPRLAALAHLAEHLSYGRTRHVRDGLLVATEGADATVYNGFTHSDQTEYFAVVPAASVERMLWIESERMAFALDALDAEALTLEQRIVTNEYSQRMLARGHGDLDLTIARELYPEGHPRRVPYALPEGIAAVTLPDVQRFLRAEYTPANATLTVAGRFDTAQVRAWIERYFGAIASAPAVTHPRPQQPPTLTGERVVRYRLPSANDAVVMVWPTAPLRTSGDAELDVVAELLARRPDGILRTALVESGAATSVAAMQRSDDDGSEFWLQVSLAPDRSFDPVLDAVDRALLALRRTTLPAAPVESVVHEWTRRTVQYAQSPLSRWSLVSEHPDADDPGLLRTDLRRYTAVRPEAVREAVARWLPLDRRLVVLIERDPHAPPGGVVESARSR